MRVCDRGGSSNFINQDGLGADNVKPTSQEVSHQKAKMIKDDCFSRHLHLEKSHGCDIEIKGRSPIF